MAEAEENENDDSTYGFLKFKSVSYVYLSRKGIRNPSETQKHRRNNFQKIFFYQQLFCT